MKPTFHTRNPIDQLRHEDIKAFPVWEFATDEEGSLGQDETWVRPVKTKVVPVEAFSLSVAARFTTAAGKQLEGIDGVTTFGSLAIVHAAVLTDTDYVFIPWPGYSDALRSSKEAARGLNLSKSELFPPRYELVIPVEGVQSPVHGEYAYSET